MPAKQTPAQSAQLSPLLEERSPSLCRERVGDEAPLTPPAAGPAAPDPAPAPRIALEGVLLVGCRSRGSAGRCKLSPWRHCADMAWMEGPVPTPTPTDAATPTPAAEAEWCAPADLIDMGRLAPPPPPTATPAGNVDMEPTPPATAPLDKLLPPVVLVVAMAAWPRTRSCARTSALP
eukprot:COSAG06_NODE_11106_length_1566_cov_1.451261_1_plen_176_part_10